jgi:YidC/Oxa1 family membrane protein insertase
MQPQIPGQKDTRGNMMLLVMMMLLFLSFWVLKPYFWPDKPPIAKPPEQDVTPEKVDRGPGFFTRILAQAFAPPKRPKEVVKDPELLKLVVLGTPNGHLEATLDPRGAGVRKLVMNHFQKADAYGKPVFIPGTHDKLSLDLIPEDRNTEIGSFLFYHYGNPLDEDYPLDTLGKRIWKRVKPEVVNEGEIYQEAVFETKIQGVKVTKTYTLQPRWYHLGLEIRLELLDKTDPEARPDLIEKGEDWQPFRYQLMAGHGLPIEGQWYTSTLRNAMIGKVNDGSEERILQDLRTIVQKGGGDPVERGEGASSIRYFGPAVQYFASLVCVETRDQENLDLFEHARPLLLESAVKCTVVSSDDPDLVVVADSTTGSKLTLRYARDADHEKFKDVLRTPGDLIVIYRPVIERSGRSYDVLTDVRSAKDTAALFHNDITVAASTPKSRSSVLRLKPGEPITHKFTLYNGPAKVRLLGHLRLDAPVEGKPVGDYAVDPSLVDHYHDDLLLATVTDYPSSWLGRMFNAVGLTRLVLTITNVLHWILWGISRVIPVYGLCIILLTLMVRGMMFPISRKQALMGQKMQALAPELKKLTEKFKDNPQGKQMAQMELYRKHGVNPIGTCWVGFLQMPIYLGLFYALQESIHFRLAPFLWIDNLAAPDMLFWWTDSIPWISRWNDYGSMVFLGPFFNLLPILAAGLTLVHQKLSMPPATDEQSAMQQKMMKYMVVFMAFMFYKVAAGVALYYVVSNLWNITERRLLPKRKPGEPLPEVKNAKPGLFARFLEQLQQASQEKNRGNTGVVVTVTPPAATNGTPPATGVTATPPALPPPGQASGKKKKNRDRRKGANPSTAGTNVSATPPPAPGILDKLRAWWAEVLKQAAKK